MWEHQVGLYQGANMGLLKTVFEVNLGLFGKPAADRCVLMVPSSNMRVDENFQLTSEDPTAFRHSRSPWHHADGEPYRNTHFRY